MYSEHVAEWLDGSIPLIKSCLARRMDFSRSLSLQQGFRWPIVAMSQLWCYCDNLGGDGGKVIWCGSRPRMLIRKQGLIQIPVKYVTLADLGLASTVN